MRYHLRQAFLAMRGNLTATLATLTTMVLALATLGAVALLTLNVERGLGALEARSEVAAFLEDGADTEAILTRAQALPEVREARVVGKEQVLAEMRRAYPYVGEAAELAGNPFPDTVRLRVERVADTVTVAKTLGALPGVESVEYGADHVERVTRTLSALRTGGYALVGFLLLGTLFNILNAVRVAMYARRSEINVMRLLGARRSFIRLPYLVEGLALGALGALVACGVLWGGYTALTGQIGTWLPSVPLVRDTATLARIGGALLGIGVVVGLLGSAVASARYLRELE